jgi:HJR/Mrr/RecB family endonuclease
MQKKITKSEPLLVPSNIGDGSFTVNFLVNDKSLVTAGHSLARIQKGNESLIELISPADGIFNTLCIDGHSVNAGSLIATIQYEAEVDDTNPKPRPEDFGLTQNAIRKIALFKSFENVESEYRSILNQVEKLQADKNRKNFLKLSGVFLVIASISFALLMYLLMSLGLGLIPYGILKYFGFKDQLLYFICVATIFTLITFVGFKDLFRNKELSPQKKLDTLLAKIPGLTQEDKILYVKKSLSFFSKIKKYQLALNEYNSRVAETGFLWWNQLSSYALEEAVAKMFNRKGYKAVVTKKSGDGGVDVIVEINEKTLLIQCKGWQSKVPVKDVRELAGVAAHYKNRNSVSVVVGTNGFTDEAIRFAKISNVELWDSKVLASIAKGQYEI